MPRFAEPQPYVMPVEAWRVPKIFNADGSSDGDSRLELSKIVSWVAKNAKLRILEDLSALPFNAIGLRPTDGTIVIAQHGGLAFGFPGHWIVRYPDGLFVAMDNDKFERTFSSEVGY